MMRNIDDGGRCGVGKVAENCLHVLNPKTRRLRVGAWDVAVVHVGEHQNPAIFHTKKLKKMQFSDYTSF